MKKIFLSCILTILLIACVGCSGNQYNAVLFSNAETWLSDDFLKENRVKAYYPNENYIEGESVSADKYIYEENAPTSKTFIITEKSEFDVISPKYPSTVDFERKIVILYIFSDIYPNREYHLDKIDLQEQTLSVYYKLEKKQGNDAVAPYQRCLMVIIDRVEIKTVNFFAQK